MTQESRLSIALLFMRLSVFLVMLMWTLDKFINPQHASAVYEGFYFIKGVGPGLLTLIGSLELVVLVAFVVGYQKKWTYGAVLLFHAVSTLSSYQQYFAPYTGPNLLFFAAWPMLAACYALFTLREFDTRWAIEK
ncbi:MAG TPA: hypothetical protein VGA00_06310 [Acidiferrobacterales bacterium]